MKVRNGNKLVSVINNNKIWVYKSTLHHQNTGFPKFNLKIFKGLCIAYVSTWMIFVEIRVEPNIPFLVATVYLKSLFLTWPVSLKLLVLVNFRTPCRVGGRPNFTFFSLVKLATWSCIHLTFFSLQNTESSCKSLYRRKIIVVIKIYGQGIIPGASWTLRAEQR